MDDDFCTDDEFFMSDDSVSFESHQGLPSPILRPHLVAKREFINGLKKQALTTLIPVLPAPDTDLYVIGNGAGAEKRHGIDSQAFDFGTFIPHLLQLLGNRDCVAYISTWTMNAFHARSMVDLLEAGAISALTVVTDPYFKRREAAIANLLIMAAQRHPDRVRFLAFKNHVKVICLQAPDDRTVTVTGSANLSAQPRCEQYVLTTAPDVYAFFRDEFFEVMLNAESKSAHQRT